MKVYRLERTLWLPRAPELLFPFFADARNLGKITPAWLNFEILKPSPEGLRKGSIIDYRIRVHGFPLKWRTEITEWDPPFQFVDVQLRGPYRLWKHRHRFLASEDGTLCVDEVEYSPIGGALVNLLFVRRDVERIFDYRAKKLKKLFR
jgi:ligand-binding SRPBCC domain-containing protein